MNCGWYGDFMLVLGVLFLACQVLYWLAFQGAVLWLVVAAIGALERYCEGG